MPPVSLVDNPILSQPPEARDPETICRIVEEEIELFSERSQEDKLQSLNAIEQVLTPLAPAPPTDDLGDGSRGGLRGPGAPPAFFLDRNLAKAPHIIEPQTEQEISNIIQDAAANGKIVRVVGSGHSVAASIHEDTATSVLISLKNFQGIEITNATASTPARVKVGGGCHLGKDPEDKSSTLHNSLLWNINQAGYALPDLGGITHQTVAGFLMTGSSGGSTADGLHDYIIALTIIDGTGKIHNLTKDSETDSDTFYAAGVSMGLLGICTSVTFILKETFFIKGTQTISPISPLSPNPSEGCPVDMLGPGNQQVPSLLKHMQNTEYTRLIWWPQPGLNRITVWQAEGMSPINPATGKLWDIVKYEELPQIGGSSELAQAAARLVLLALNFFESDNIIYRSVAAKLLALFNPITKGGQAGAQQFRDWWYSGLPMDNEISDKIMPVSFTELWIPIQQTQQVMNGLNDLWKSNFKAIGNFFTEIYAGKKSPFWMSPSYDSGDVVRVDATWFTANERGNPEEFFKPYWEKFGVSGYETRYHWGKYMPEEYGKVVGQRFSKYTQWMEIRARMDPNQVFVTSYWRTRLNIPPVA